MIYGATTRHIDAHVPERYNLIATSVWLFIGDVGSVTGSNIIGLAVAAMCNGVASPYICAKEG